MVSRIEDPTEIRGPTDIKTELEIGRTVTDVDSDGGIGVANGNSSSTKYNPT